MKNAGSSSGMVAALRIGIGMSIPETLLGSFNQHAESVGRECTTNQRSRPDHLEETEHNPLMSLSSRAFKQVAEAEAGRYRDIRELRGHGAEHLRR